MFWSSQMGFEEREIDKKLKAKDIDLNSILDDMHCLQEIRNSNEQLLIFLKRDDNFRTLVDSVLITEENADDGRQPKDKYRFAHQCCEALCIGAREFYPELEKHKDLLQKMANFLAENSGRLNPLTVSFYGRTLISFLSTEPEKFIAVLESSNFLDGSFYCLGNSSIFELLCTIPNCMPDPVFRDRVKKWYLEKEFTQKMLDLLSPNQPSNTHENVAALWVEFVKALREYQYNVEQAPDLLLDSIQSEENVAKLLAQMFPPEGIEFTPSIVANGALVLNALLETNQIRNSPSALLAQEAQNIANDNSLTDLQPTFSLNSTENTISSTSQLMMDTERMVETRCAEHASDIITCIIYGLKAIELNQKATATKMNASSHQEQHNNSSFKDSANALAKLKLVDYEDSPIKVVDYSDSVATDNDAEEEHIDMNTRMEDFCGDVLNNCMQLLINLTNTNFLPTHLELCRAFANQNNSLSLLFEHVEVNPSCSIFNAQLMTLVLHIFYSSTGPTQRPLIDFIIKDFNLPGFIVRVLPDWMLDDEEADSSTAVPKHIPLSKRLFCVAKRSFFMHLANRLRHAESGSPNAEYIREMIQELPNYKQWEDFCSASVQSFVDHNRSEKMNSYSTIARTSNTIEIDELPEDNFLTLDTSPPPPHLSSSSSS